MEIFYLDSKGTLTSTKKLENYTMGNSTWIRMVNPSPEEMSKVSKLTSIPEEEFIDFLEDEERSRIEQGKYLQIIYRTPLTGKGEITTTSFCVFFINHLFVTVERNNTEVLDKLASVLRAGKFKLLFKKSAGFFIYHVLDNINDEFQKSIKQIGYLVKKHKMDYDKSSENQLLRIYSSNITLSHFNHALIANRDVLTALKRSKLKAFTKVDIERFDDLYYDTLQLIDTEKIERDVLSTMFNFQTILASYRLNNFLKRITALALIIAVPTLISSIYGMNVILPFEKSPYAFFGLMVIMLGISLLGFVYMKKRDWI